MTEGAVENGEGANLYIYIYISIHRALYGVKGMAQLRLGSNSNLASLTAEKIVCSPGAWFKSVLVM